MELHWNKTLWTLCILMTAKYIVCSGNYGTSNETGYNKDKLSADYNTGQSFNVMEEYEDGIATRKKRSSTVGLVDIAKFEDSSGPGKQISVYVDDTMTKLIFSVAVERSNPVIAAVKPSGSPYSARPAVNGSSSQGTVVATLDIPITSADYGIWKFSKMDASTWVVTIQGKSSVFITHQLFELGSNTPVSDYPIIGKSYKLEVTVEELSQVKSVDMGFLYSKSKIAPVGMAPLVAKGNNKFEAAKVTMTSEAIMVGIQGKDLSGHPYKRLDTTEIIPVSLKLEVPLHTATNVEEHKSLNITFTVTNILSKTQDIDIRIEDDEGLVQAPKVVSSSNLKAGENFTGFFILKAGSGGITTLVKIQARQNLGGGSFSTGPIEWRNVTIIQKTTTSASTTSVSTTTSSTTPRTTLSSTTQASSSTPFGSHVAVVKKANTNLVDIARFIDTAPASKDYTVSVDSTIKRLIFRVFVENSKPVIMVTKPSGMPYSVHPILDNVGSGTVKATMDITITSADYGVWKFKKLDGNTWDVTIQAESPVYVTQQLFELGSFVPFTDNPVPEKSYKLEITVTGLSNIKSVSSAFLVLKQDMVGAGFATLTHKSGNIYAATRVQIPKGVFMIGIQGMDNTGHTYRRIDPTEIKPLSLKLDVPSYAGATIVEYSTFNITFTVTNLLTTAQEIDVRIIDERNFAQAPTTLSVDSLKAGAQFTGTFVLKVEFAGLSTAVKIIAIPRIAHKFGPGPEEIRNFTVIKNETTTTSITTPSSSLTTSSADQSTSTTSADQSTSTTSTTSTTSMTSMTSTSTASSSTTSQDSSTSSTAHKPSNNSSQTDANDSSKISVGAAVAVVVGCVIAGIIVGGGAVAVVTSVHAKSKTTKVEPFKPTTERRFSENKKAPTVPSNAKFAPWK